MLLGISCPDVALGARRRRLVATIVGVITIIGLVSQAQAANVPLDGYTQGIEKANRFSPLEGAGSHGALGFGLGMGTSVVPSGIGLTQTTNVLPKVYLVKGFSLPIDLGLSFGAAKDAMLQQLAGYAQWTFYQDFARPALALRANYSRLHDGNDSDTTALGFDLAVSYGFLRYFTVYLVGGVQDNALSLQSNGLTNLALVSSPASAHQQLWSASELCGLQIRILPPFVTTTFETLVAGGRREAYSVKIALGL